MRPMMPPGAMQMGNALAQGDVGNMGYRYDGAIRNHIPTDGVIDGFQRDYGQVSPGIPQSPDQAKHRDKFGFTLGGPGKTEGQARLAQIIDQFEREHGEGATLAILEEVYRQVGGGQSKGLYARRAGLKGFPAQVAKGQAKVGQGM